MAPGPLAWWWMQNETDPLQRIAVTNSWAEANLMTTLRQWRDQAEEARLHPHRRAVLTTCRPTSCTHVRLATDWIQKLTEDDPAHRDELVNWGRKAIARIQGFHASRYKDMPDPNEARFTFLKPTGPVEAVALSPIIGE